MRSPLSLLFSKVKRPNSLSVSSQGRFSSSLITFVTLLWTLYSHMRKSSASHQTPDDVQPCSLPSCLWAPCHLTQENNRKAVYAKPVRYRKQIQPEGHVKGVRNWVKVQVTESKPVQQVLTGLQYSMWTAYKLYAVKGWERRRHQLRTHTSHRQWGLHIRRVPKKI